MKVIALVDCVGLNYDLKKDDEAVLSPEIANKLIMFGYVEELESTNTDGSQGNSSTDRSILTVDDLPHKSGWYELPNGEKVQGREKAEEALAELNNEKSDE